MKIVRECHEHLWLFSADSFLKEKNNDTIKITIIQTNPLFIIYIFLLLFLFKVCSLTFPIWSYTSFLLHITTSGSKKLCVIKVKSAWDHWTVALFLF